MEVICQQCNKSYEVRKYRVEITKYCSRKCLALATRVILTKNCEICNIEFTHIASRANSAKYCSRQCYHKAQYIKGTVTYKCHHCDKEFLSSPSHKRKYCSKACTQKSNISTWKPSFTYQRKLLERRGLIEKCNRCGYEECKKILGVHHIDRNRNNNKLENLEILCPNCHSLEHNKHIAHGFKE